MASWGATVFRAGVSSSRTHSWLQQQRAEELAVRWKTCSPIWLGRMAEMSEKISVNDVLKRQIIEMMFIGKKLEETCLECLIERRWVNETTKCSHSNGKSWSFSKVPDLSQFSDPLFIPWGKKTVVVKWKGFGDMRRKDLVKVSSSCPRGPSAISRGSHNCKMGCSSFTSAAEINYPDTPQTKQIRGWLKKLISSCRRLYTILVGKPRQEFHIGITSHPHSNVKSNGHLLLTCLFVLN